jgi:hypothetical protein
VFPWASNNEEAMNINFTMKNREGTNSLPLHNAMDSSDKLRHAAAKRNRCAERDPFLWRERDRGRGVGIHGRWGRRSGSIYLRENKERHAKEMPQGTKGTTNAAVLHERKGRRRHR